MNQPSIMLQTLLAGRIDVSASDDREIKAITLDSRRATPGCLFLARNGLAAHGLTFAEQAIDRGAIAVLWEPDEGAKPPEFPAEIFAAPLENFSAAAGEIASRYFRDPSRALSVIGITGTNGKTTVSQLVAQVLDSAGCPCGLIGTLGSGRFGNLESGDLTTPDVVELQQQLAGFVETGCTQVAMEVSSHALDQGRVQGTRFHTAVFTNLSRDHLDYHLDEQAYAAAKGKLFAADGLACAVINGEDPVGQNLLQRCAHLEKIIVYGAQSPGTFSQPNIHSLFAQDVDYTDNGLTFTVVFGEQQQPVSVPMIGRFNVYNVLAVMGVLLGQGLSLQAASENLAGIEQIKGRMERFGGDDKPLVIVDYAHTPDALLQALAAARAHARRQLVCVFGCGGDRDRGKRPEMAGIAERLADVVLVTDDNPRTESATEIVAEILAGFANPEAVSVIHDRAAAIRQAVVNAKPGDVVLVAGKGHEEFQLTGNEKKYFSDSGEVVKSLGGQAA